MKGFPFPRRWLLAALLLGFMGASAEAKPAKMRDIADAVAANPILTRLAAMVQGSGQGMFLSSRGPFVLFAPTNSAFASLPPGTLEALLRPENKVRLQDILLFHVVYGKMLTVKDLLSLKTLLSCEGNPLPLRTTRSGTQLVLKAKVVHGDIRCTNGIIDEIDTVLMPPEASLPPLALVSPPPAPLPATNAPPAHPADVTNAAPAETNAAPVIPVAPIVAPETTPH